MKLEMNTANKITTVRILAIPLYIIFLYFDMPATNRLACFIFVLLSFTDFLDGYIARKYNMVSDLGKILDPIADKVIVSAALIAFIDLDRVPAWVVMLFLARDFTMEALRNHASSKGVIIAAGIWGKLKTATQMVALAMLTWYETFLIFDWKLLGNIALYLSLALSIYSAIIYFISYSRLIKEHGSGSENGTSEEATTKED